ncbi:hypothetical protein KFL_001910160 [Klebsormidium nitens]|uniref:TMEM14 family protein n=1 Tax=Klebsormidium nitens TaxID=105231 RepID=A0A1Y1I6Z5_KLENI|nr:hypothetical protein KFL_001910160 [Klebsormidium nitens]|eukprot:GAQ84497.1 hypothetical protein KFL_001910160 [Klebsormidium nitens]
MAAATFVRAPLCRAPVACLASSSNADVSARSSCVAAFSFGSPKSARITRRQASRALSSSLWGQRAASRSSPFCKETGKGASLRKRQSGASGGALQAQAVSQETASIWTAVYGLLLLGGGTSAYLKSGSKQSVISGALGAALSAMAYYLESQESTHQTGLAVAFGYSILFASVFGIRLFATKKAFPAAPLLALSLASAFVFASAYSA